MTKPEVTSEIENVILQWDETSVRNGDFGARVFLFQNKEFGHIHNNGDLDIVFGINITAELLRQNLVQKHLYVPKTSITYRVLSSEKIPFAISLLRFSWFLNAFINNAISPSILENELSKLPENLSSVYLKQK